MYPYLGFVPLWIVAGIAGAIFASTLAVNLKRIWLTLAAAAAGAFIAITLVLLSKWAAQTVPIHSYGVMILTGFIAGVWITARRSPQIGIEPHHCVDMGIHGIFWGLFGARLFHIAMHWSDYSPFQEHFEPARILDWFKLWEGGLVFFGTFLFVIPAAWLYCRRHKLPRLPFLDLLAPGLITGLAFGRIGCFLNGCCFGRVCNVPWAVRFPGRIVHDSDAHSWHAAQGLILRSAPTSLPVHPTQLYASAAAALTAAFLYVLWKYRRYDGQILSLMLIMAGTTRFFEELLRDDDFAAFPSISASLTIAQWVALGIVAAGFGMMFYFRQRAAQFRAQPAAI